MAFFCVSFLFSPSVTPSLLSHPPPLLQLAKNLPPRTIGYPWTLAFGTSKHGMSIKTLYRAMQGQDTPVLMVIKDSDGQVSSRPSTSSGTTERKGESLGVSVCLQVFGALASEPFKVSDGFYGTGETFLFTFNPEFEVTLSLMG